MTWKLFVSHHKEKGMAYKVQCVSSFYVTIPRCLCFAALPGGT